MQSLNKYQAFNNYFHFVWGCFVYNDCVAQVGLELTAILLPQPPLCWDISGTSGAFTHQMTHYVKLLCCQLTEKEGPKYFPSLNPLSSSLVSTEHLSPKRLLWLVHEKRAPELISVILPQLSIDCSNTKAHLHVNSSGFPSKYTKAMQRQ